MGSVPLLHCHYSSICIVVSDPPSAERTLRLVRRSEDCEGGGTMRQGGAHNHPSSQAVHARLVFFMMR